MSRQAKTLASALSEEPAAAALLWRVRVSREAALCIASADAVRQAGFDPTEPGACELRDGILLLTVNSAACAAKLRQGLPALRKLLQQQGVEVIEMRVRIQPALMTYREVASTDASTDGRSGSSQAVPNKTLSVEAGLGFADKLVLTLPDTPLRRAAERLRATLRRSLTQNR